MYTGPNITKNGLVLNLDAANIKSFRGEPTVNLQDPDINNWSKTAIVEVLTELSPIGTTSYSITDNSSNYLGITRNITVLNNSSTYTISVYIKKTFGATSARLGFNSGFTGGTTLVQLNQRFNSDTGVGNVGTSVDLGNWWRWSFQLTNNNTGNTTLYCTFYPATGFYNSGDNALATGTAIISGIQLEEKPYATPFVNGTRGSTVATGGGWKDISGNDNNGDLVNGPIYNNDNLGSLVFDGVDDLVLLGTNMYLYTYDSSYTVEAFIKLNTLSRINSIIGDLQFDYWSFRINSDNRLLLRHRLNNSIQNQLIGNTVFSINQYYHCVGVFNKNLGMKLFVNGKLDGENMNTTIFGLNSSTRGPRFIGQNRTGSPTSPQILDGSIYLIKFYNKELSSEEVLRNYNGVKSRFGL
jgi:hypothetical protein